jgi:hypothetical protein
MIRRIKEKFLGIRLKKILLILWPFMTAALVFLGVGVAVKEPQLIESYYSRGVYPSIASLFTSLSNLISFSLWDIFWVVTILIIGTGLVLVLFRKLKFSWLILRMAQFMSVLYAFFYIVWGFNYFRPTFEVRIGWVKPRTDETVFRSVLDSMIGHTNFSYTQVSPDDYPVIDRLVEESYLRNKVTLGINYPNGSRHPKTMLFSSFFAKSGVSGYFGPFFNEVHLNYYLLPMEYPYVLAHEKAHQFGITNEAEANLAAFIVCTTSPDKRLQYSGYVNLLVYFLSDAANLKDAREFIRKIEKPVFLDLRFQRSHWQGLQNKTLDQVQTAANNAYLKTNHIEEGVKNYNQVVGLVMSWYYNENRIKKIINSK